MWNQLNENTRERIFAPDGGALLDIWVFETDWPDWELLLHYLVANFVCVYSENGSTAALPKIEVIFARSNKVTVLLDVTLCGFNLHCHFFEPQRIEMDLLPERVDSASKAQSVFNLMRDVATLLKKPVFLSPEFACADDRELKDLAVCCRPQDRKTTI